MSGSRVSAEGGSTAVGGDVNAPLININADDSSTVNVTIEQQIVRELPSFLGAVIVVFSQQSVSEYGRGPRRELSAEVLVKLKYNNLPEGHHLIKDYNRHALVLEQAYLGVEQKNSDARYLVRRKAGIVYQSKIKQAFNGANATPAQVCEYVKANLDSMVEGVVSQLLGDYKKSADLKVEEEMAHLAISLVVADAVIECEVLERP
jgi:hypothetical protein